MPNAPRNPHLATATSASNRVMAAYREHQSRLNQLPPSGQLFHYTTAEGLKGIIENNELWASSAYFLNDAKEMTYGLEVVKEALDEWSTASRCDEESLATGLADHLKRTLDDYLNGNVVVPVYLACFCEDGNLLTQWRTYGASGGYALGFDFLSREHDRKLMPEPSVYSPAIIKVEYDRPEQLRRCRNLLEAILPVFDEPATAEAIREVAAFPMANYDFLFRIIFEMLLEEAAGFKAEAFSVEREWRLIVRRRELIKQGRDDGGKTPSVIRFKSSQGYLVPYIRLIPAKSGAKIPLRSIRTGPTIDRLRAVISLCELLNQNGLQGVKLDHAGISARS